jgi:hypothetical protein
MQKDKYKIEMVQRRAARYVTNRYHNKSSVNDMLAGKSEVANIGREKDKCKINNAV